MARNTHDRLKRTLLLCFVVVSVALIVSMYVTDLAGSNDPAPAYYRGAPTLEPSIQGTFTAPTRERAEPGQVPATPPGVQNDPPKRLFDDV
jgi:hypothetical protein